MLAIDGMLERSKGTVCKTVKPVVQIHLPSQKIVYEYRYNRYWMGRYK